MSGVSGEDLRKQTVAVIPTRIMSSLDAPDTFVGTRRRLCVRNKVTNELMVLHFPENFLMIFCMLTCRLDY